MFLGFILGIILTVLAAAGAGYMVVTNGVIDASTDAKPGFVEKWAARNSLRPDSTADFPRMSNPMAAQ